jgi:hypothetical protein
MHVSDSTNQVGQDYVATGVLLILGTNKQPFEPKLTNTHSGNLHGLLPVLHRSDRWTEPVRPVATAAAQQMFQRALVTSLGPGTKTPPKTQPAWKKNPTQSQPKHLQICQELTNTNTTQRHMD